MRRATICLSLLWLGVGFGLSLRAAGNAAFTIDLPFATNAATPIWLGHPTLVASTFASVALPITPADAKQSLLVTIIMDEAPNGFLRLIWQGNSGAQTLAENFEEGISMSNQRSLLIPPETLSGGGSLLLQADQATLGVRRVKLEWLDPTLDLDSPKIEEQQVTPEVGATQPVSAFDGAPAVELPAAWNENLVTVPIQQQPDRIDQGVDYSVVLDHVPTVVRLGGQENGLPLDCTLTIWVNNKLAATVAPELPSLQDPGYFFSSALTQYIGWRDVTQLLPPALFAVGTNTLQISVTDSSTSAASFPLAVRALSLQLLYPGTVEASAAAAATTNAPSILTTNAPLAEP